MNHYTVYKITNLIDGKYYIGKHKCSCGKCSYYGSGKLIQRAIKKHGIEHFKKEILFSFDTEDEMNKKEAELVTEELIASGSVYNLCPGGQGGWGYINNNEETRIEKNRKAASISNERGAFSLGGKVSGAKNLRKLRNEGRIRYDGFAGKHHTDEHKKKHSEFMKQFRGEKSSQFGTMWITNGTENKKIKKDVDSIPEGWYKGRKMKSR